MNKRLRGLAVAAATSTLGIGLVVAGPVTGASASAADCEHGANGFVDISDNLGGAEVRAVDLGSGVWVTLEHTIVSGQDRGFARIRGTGTRNNDLVWMDWTQDGGRHWLQCGPFSVDRGNGTSKTSAAKKVEYNKPQYQFRACGRRPMARVTKCTNWW